MWKIARLAVVASCLLALGPGSPRVADNVRGAIGDHRGREFWIAFQPNDNNADPETRLIAIVTSDVTTRVRWTHPDTWTDPTPTEISVDVAADAPAVIDFALNDDHLDVSGKGIYVEADDDIVLHVFMQSSESNEGYLAFPEHSLGTKYIVLAYPGQEREHGKKHEKEKWASQFLVAATADGTEVKITPPADSGKASKTVPLNRGQTYQLRDDNDGADLSGTVVESLGGAPVAVFAGHEFALLRGGKKANHLVEQLPPVSAWGSVYHVLPINRSEGDIVKVAAAFDGTELTIETADSRSRLLFEDDCSAVLQAAETCHFKLAVPATITDKDNKPILVVQLTSGASYTNENKKGSFKAGPLMTLVPPVAQFLDRYTVDITQEIKPVNRNVHRLQLIAPQKMQIEYVGPKESIDLELTKSGDFYEAQVNVEKGRHEVSADKPFGLMVYGLHPKASYGYLGGQGLRPLSVSTLTLLPESASKDLGEEHCVDATVSFQNNQAAGVWVDFDVSGQHSKEGRVFTSGGVAEFCYIGDTAGVDTIIATAGHALDGATVVWGGAIIPAGLLDGDFKAGMKVDGVILSPYWEEGSELFGSPLCTVSVCGRGNLDDGSHTAGPRSGSVWAWFGGSPRKEQSFISQSGFGLTGTELRVGFWLWQGATGSEGDRLDVYLDGQRLTWTLPDGGDCSALGVDAACYQPVAIYTKLDYVSETHSLEFRFRSLGTSPNVTNFSVDDVTVIDATADDVAFLFGDTP